MIFVVYGISNYIFMYGFRIVYFFINKVMGNKDERNNFNIGNYKNEKEISGNTKNRLTNKSGLSLNANSDSANRSSNAVKLYQKILNYHDSKEVSNSSSLTNSRASATMDNTSMSIN